ncbi:MAG: WD40 repeat domain-containing protein [Gemmataceae bacterium]
MPKGATARLGTLRLFHPGTVDFKAFTPDGRFLITATCDPVMAEGPEGTLFHVWDLSSGRRVRQFGHAEGITHAVQSPGGWRIASVGPGGTFLWEIPSGRLVRQVEKQREPAPTRDRERYAFHDEKTLVALREGWLETLDLASGRRVGRVRLFEPDSAVTINDPTRLSPDGKTLVKFGGESIEFIDTLTAKARGQFGIEVECSVSYHPDGKVFALAQREKRTVAIHDAGTLRKLREWQLAEGVDHNPLEDWPAFPFVPGGSLLATPGLKGSVDLWDWATGAFVRPLGKSAYPLGGLVFSHDGKVMASGRDLGRVGVFDVATGRELFPAKGHRQAVDSIRYIDKNTLFSSSAFGGSAFLWDVRTCRVVRSLPEGDSHDVISPDCKVRARPNADGTVLLLDVETGKKRRLLGTSQPRPKPGPNDLPLHLLPRAVAFSPDGSVLAYGVPRGPIRLWSVDSGEERGRLRKWGDREVVKCLAFSPDGRRLVAGGVGTVEVWDTTRGSLLRQMTVPVRGMKYPGNLIPPIGGVNAVAFSQDGRSVTAVNSDGPVRLWEISSGRQFVLSGRRLGEPGHGTAVACSPDGRFVASAELGRGITLWDVASGREVTRFRPTGGREVRALAFSPDGRALASGGEDVTILLWEVPP